MTTQTAAATPEKPKSCEPGRIRGEPGNGFVRCQGSRQEKLSKPTSRRSKAKNPSAKETAKSGTAKSETAKSEAAKSEAAKPEAAKSEIAKSEPAKAETAKTEAAKTDAAKPDAATPATPLVASKSFMAPPDPSASKLIEPSKPL